MTSEQSACDACRESVESSLGLVIADFSPRNFERRESFQETARKTGRKLVAMAKDVYMLHNLQCINGSCMTEGLKIYNRSWINRRENESKKGSTSLWRSIC
jgi:ribonuclease J